MEFSHREILNVIRTSQGERLTFSQIAAKVGCSERTVLRAVKVFESTNQVKRLNRGQGKAGGSIYEVITHDQP